MTPFHSISTSTFKQCVQPWDTNRFRLGTMNHCFSDTPVKMYFTDKAHYGGGAWGYVMCDLDGKGF